MTFIDSIDPFVRQLIIVPFIVIGLGIFIAIISKKLVLGTLTTLLLNMLYEFWYMNQYSEMKLTVWNIIFPLITLFVSWLVLAIIKQENKTEVNHNAK